MIVKIIKLAGLVGRQCTTLDRGGYDFESNVGCTDYSKISNR